MFLSDSLRVSPPARDPQATDATAGAERGQFLPASSAVFSWLESQVAPRVDFGANLSEANSPTCPKRILPVPAAL